MYLLSCKLYIDSNVRIYILTIFPQRSFILFYVGFFVVFLNFNIVLLLFCNVVVGNTIYVYGNASNKLLLLLL